MKSPHISLSVPRLLIQISIAHLTGFLMQHQLLDHWIHDQNISGWNLDLFEFISIIMFSTPIFYLIVYRDLKKKNIQDQNLLDQYQKFKVILNDSPLGAFIYGRDGFIYVSKKYCNIVGYEESEILGKKFKEVPFLDQETSRMLNEIGEKRFKHLSVLDYYTVSAKQKDGAKIELEFRAKLGSFNEKEVILGSIADVTQRVKLETSLKNSEQLYRRLFESNMDIALILNHDGKILDINQAGEEATGYNRKELRGLHFSNLVYPDELQKTKATFEKVLQGQSIRNEIKGTNKNGDVVYTAVSSMPLFNDGEVTGIFSLIRDITEQKQQLETIQRMAYYDSLTGLPNRHYFTEKIQTVVANAEKRDSQVALLYFDLDRLKVVNDNLGHVAGDKLLQYTSKRFKSIIRDRGFISRLGGDEFTVIVPFYQYIEEVIDLAEEVLSGFNVPFEIEGDLIQAKISIGIAHYPEHGKNVKTLIQSADMAMFHAKRLGGHQYKLFNSSLESKSKKLFDLEKDFSRAIKNQEFFLVYQPKVDADAHKIRGVEALIRWKHPVKGLIAPCDFIPMAEVTGLIVPLGDWVLREACRQAKQWQDNGLSPLRIAVNVSALQFQQIDFPEKVREILVETSLDPKWLEIEITEGTLMEENETVIGCVTRLKKMGIYISLDDFGTGYSSMKYLKQYPLHALKIDRSFIDMVDQHKERAAIVQSIIQLAHGLSMEVVAEGVEREEELVFTQAHGVDEIQGYLISKPLQTAELEKFITEYNQKKPSN